jgi:hypothetical protein
MSKRWGIKNLTMNSYQKLKKQIEKLKEHKLILKQGLVSVCINPESPVSISIINHHKNKYKSIDDVFQEYQNNNYEMD